MYWIAVDINGKEVKIATLMEVLPDALNHKNKFIT